MLNFTLQGMALLVWPHEVEYALFSYHGCTRQAREGKAGEAGIKEEVQGENPTKESPPIVSPLSFVWCATVSI